MDGDGYDPDHSIVRIGAEQRRPCPGGDVASLVRTAAPSMESVDCPPEKRPSFVADAATGGKSSSTSSTGALAPSDRCPRAAPKYVPCPEGADECAEPGVGSGHAYDPSHYHAGCEASLTLISNAQRAQWWRGAATAPCQQHRSRGDCHYL